MTLQTIIGRHVAPAHRDRDAQPARARQRVRPDHARRARRSAQGAGRGRQRPHRRAARRRQAFLHRRRPFVARPSAQPRRSRRNIRCATCWRSLDGLPKPTIAVVQGGAIGGGAGFVTCCDVAIATRAAFFSIPEVRVGMAPMGIMPFMIRAIGHRAFRRYGLSGERIQAADALRLGLVHEVCEPMVLDATLAQIIDALLLGAPHATSALKAAAARYASPNLDEIMAQRAAAARSEIGGGAGRHRGLPREAQAELVSGMMALSCVMPGLVPGIHVLITACKTKSWMAGTSPAMTTRRCSLGSRSIEEKSRSADGAAQRRAGRRQRPSRKLGRAGVAQSAQVSNSPARSIRSIRAATRDLGQALLSRFQVAAGAARSSGGAGAGRRRRRSAARRRGGGRAQRHGVLLRLRRGLSTPRPPGSGASWPP